VIAAETSRVVEAAKAQAVLAAALELFAERGVHGTSVPQVLERAGVGASSLYRRFASKEALVNAVFRDAKRRLGAALRGRLEGPLPPRQRLRAFFRALATFARREPLTFRFLELKDHAPYLDAESRAIELAVLAPIYLECLDLQRQGALRADVAAETMIAFVWGAFVGLFKAERTHHVAVTDAALAAAEDACLRAFRGASTHEDDDGDRFDEPRPADEPAPTARARSRPTRAKDRPRAR
jgi:AcrR family transcriptional regulator